MNYYIPTIIRETSEGMARLPIADVMLQRREIWLTGEITSELADAVIAQILHLDAEAPGEEITLYIDSPGGSVTAGLAIYDVMQAVSAQIRTVCIGHRGQYGGGALCRRRPTGNPDAWRSDDTRPAGEWRHLRQRPGRAG